MVIGGTSAVAPLWAGLIAVANQQNGKIRRLHPARDLRRQGQVRLPRHHLRTINGGFNAGPGWDACTGLGSPIASTLIPFMTASSGPVKKHAKRASSKKSRSTARR